MDFAGQSTESTHQMKKLFFQILFCAIAGVGLCGQTQGEPEVPVDKNRIFSQIAASASQVQTLSSDFIQEKHFSMLKNVLFSKGHLYYKRNNQLRWELSEPTASGFAVNGKQAKRWDETSGNTRTFAVHEVPFIKVFTDQVFAWAQADFKWLQNRYRIEVLNAKPVDLKLSPILSQEKKYVDHLRITFTREVSHVQIVEVHEPDGDFTRIRFLDPKINEPLEDSLFN